MAFERLKKFVKLFKESIRKDLGLRENSSE